MSADELCQSIVDLSQAQFAALGKINHDAMQRFVLLGLGWKPDPACISALLRATFAICGN